MTQKEVQEASNEVKWLLSLNVHELESYKKTHLKEHGLTEDMEAYFDSSKVHKELNRMARQLVEMESYKCEDENNEDLHNKEGKYLDHSVTERIEQNDNA